MSDKKDYKRILSEAADEALDALFATKGAVRLYDGYPRRGKTFLGNITVVEGTVGSAPVAEGVIMEEVTFIKPHRIGSRRGRNIKPDKSKKNKYS